MSTAHARFLATRSFGSLDGLRAVSIVAVIWHHTRVQPDAWIGLSRGFLGVDLFFLISGFLIVTLLLRERRRTTTISLKSFYARRFLRIFPLYYGVLALAGAVALLAKSPEALRLRADLPFALTYASNWVPMTSLLAITWSLSAEEQFYLVWPPLERFLKKRVVLVLGAAIAASGALQLLHAPMKLDLPDFLWQTSFFPILLGVALAHVLDDERTFRAMHGLVGFRHAPLVFLAAVAVGLAFPVEDIAGAPRMALHFAMLLLLASCVVREDHVVAPLLRLAPVVRVGVLSYGLYLLHMLGRHAAHKIVGDGWLLFPATLVVTVVLAEVSYRFYESRFLELKKRFTAAAGT